jgi:hypothetical protein
MFLIFEEFLMAIRMDGCFPKQVGNLSLEQGYQLSSHLQLQCSILTPFFRSISLLPRALFLPKLSPSLKSTTHRHPRPTSHWAPRFPCTNPVSLISLPAQGYDPGTHPSDAVLFYVAELLGTAYVTLYSDLFLE